MLANKLPNFRPLIVIAYEEGLQKMICHSECRGQQLTTPTQTPTTIITIMTTITNERAKQFEEQEQEQEHE